MYSRLLKIGCLSLSLALALTALSVRAQERLPTPAELKAHVEAARGTQPVSSREVDETRQGGLVVHSVLVTAGDDYREDEVNGPVDTSSGRFGGQRWRQNANGQTVLEQPDPGEVAPERRVASVSRIATPVDGYVLSNLDAHGLGTKRYIEAATWHVVREDDIRVSMTRVTTYDDFRTVAGYTQAFHQKMTDGHPENDLETRIVSFDPAPVPRSAVAIPDTRRVLVEFPAGKTSVMLPVRYENGQFIVRVMVGQRGLDFVLDSGASGIFVEDDVAKQLGLEEYGSYSNGVNAGRFRQSIAVVPRMSVGDLTMKDVAVYTLPSLPTEGAGFKAVGLLGFDFIGDIGLKLDYARGAATAYESDSFVPPASPELAIDVRLGDGVPLTTVAVNGSASERFMIDTGSHGALLIFDRFARRYRSALVDEGGGGDLRIAYGRGVGGDFDLLPYQLRSVRIGNVDFQDFLAYVVRQHKLYDQDVDGLIGDGFLRLFDVYFDYAYSKIYFVANDLGNMQRRSVPRPKSTPIPSVSASPAP
jgi:hypothetical protein